MAPLFITVVSVRVRGSYTHTGSADTTVGVAPVQVTYLDSRMIVLFNSPLFITVVSVRVRGSYTHSADTTVGVAPVQVALWPGANSVL